MHISSITYEFKPNWVRKEHVSCLLHIHANDVYGMIDYAFDGKSYRFFPTTTSVKDATFEINLFNTPYIASCILLYHVDQIDFLAQLLKEVWEQKQKS